MSCKLPTLLSIAGSDPMGGAGIQADIRAGSVLGVHVATAITAVTAQNSKGLTEIGAVAPELLKAQLDSIIQDLLPDAIKIGLTGSFKNIQVIKTFLDSLPKYIPVVIDPILSITADSKANLFAGDEDGSAVLDKNKKLVIKEYRPLFELATAITPNKNEARILKKELQTLDSTAIIIKGGHDKNNKIEDVMYFNNKKYLATHSRIDCKNLHGTGCIFSSFLASFLALGYALPLAFELSSSKIFEIISKSNDYTLGNSDYGPLNINNYKL